LRFADRAYSVPANFRPGLRHGKMRPLEEIVNFPAAVKKKILAIQNAR
jgi:hypothetical protein